ncbi:MAG: hypothetical protein WCR42_14890 [bacterium]
MSRILFLVILIAFLGDANLFGEERVNGGYRNCTSYLYEYKDGKIDLGSKRLSESFTYDEKGNKVEYMQFYADKPIDTYCCKNPSRGNEYEKSFNIQTGDNFIKKSYKYDNRNNKVEEIELNPNGSILEKYTYKYDEKSREIEHIFYYGDSTVKEKIITKYFENSEVSEYEIYSYRLDGTLEEWNNIKYETNSNKQEMRIRKYDEKGKLIQDYLHKANGEVYDMLNPDANGKGKFMGKEFIDRTGSISGTEEGFAKTTYELDDKGRIIAVLKYSSETVVDIKCAYKYDDFGNTIEWIAYKLGVPIFKTEYIYSK